jgi:hypothetical protein
MGAPVGNQNGSKGRAWGEAVKRAIRAKYGKEWDEALQDLASKLVEAADKGDLQALKEVGDRIDGKPKQQIEQTGLDDGPMQNNLTVNFVGPAPSQA